MYNRKIVTSGEKMAVSTISELGRIPRVEALLAATGDVAGARVVDIGCGEGQVARALAAAGAEVIGYDPFIGGTDWIAEGGGRYRLAHATADALPEDDASADVVLFVFSLHHVPQASMAAALAEARRVLKAGGRLCVAEPLAEGPGQYVMELYHDETEVRRNAMAALGAHAAPAFSSEQILYFSEGRSFTDFDAYAAQAFLGMRFNGYTEADVLNPEVRRRFEEVLCDHGGKFEQRVRINIYA